MDNQWLSKPSLLPVWLLSHFSCQFYKHERSLTREFFLPQRRKAGEESATYTPGEVRNLAKQCQDLEQGPAKAPGRRAGEAGPRRPGHPGHPGQGGRKWLSPLQEESWRWARKTSGSRLVRRHLSGGSPPLGEEECGLQGTLCEAGRQGAEVPVGQRVGGCRRSPACEDLGASPRSSHRGYLGVP